MRRPIIDFPEDMVENVALVGEPGEVLVIEYRRTCNVKDCDLDKSAVFAIDPPHPLGVEQDFKKIIRHAVEYQLKMVTIPAMKSHEHQDHFNNRWRAYWATLPEGVKNGI